MKIDYQKILNKNMLKVLIEVLNNIKKNGINDGHHLYITFLTNHPGVSLPKWIKEKYPYEMTIVIQYEYYNLKINKNDFIIGLSFNNVKTDIKVSYESVLSFADPHANFGLKFPGHMALNKNKKVKISSKNIKKNNVIDFKKFKKN
tara:strand:+ start:1572 stop:2009 length:438 start_codon:yes stop_codon:yes gene_type:complete